MKGNLSCNQTRIQMSYQLKLNNKDRSNNSTEIVLMFESVNLNKCCKRA